MAKLDIKALKQEAIAELTEEAGKNIKQELKRQYSRLRYAKSVVQNIVEEIDEFLEEAEKSPGYLDTYDEVKKANKAK